MSPNTRGSFSGRTGLESGSTSTTKKQDKDKLARKIIAKLSLLKEVDVKQSLKTTITTELSENKLSLTQLKKLHDLIMAIKKTPNDSVGYYYEIYHMFNVHNPFHTGNIGVY